MAEKVKALLIFEILGKPPEHIVITLEQLIDRLGENKGIKVTDRKVHEPHPVERKDDKGDIIDKVEGLFSTFAEVEVEVDGLNLLLLIAFNMLPSCIQILEPAEFRLKNFELTNLLSEIVVRMHKYDEIAKAILIERDGLVKELEKLKGRYGNINLSQGGVGVMEPSADEKIEEPAGKYKDSAKIEKD